MAEPQAMHHVIQAALQQTHQHVARIALGLLGPLKIAAELALEDTVIMLHLLLFA